jgi:hypothetical protein
LVAIREVQIERHEFGSFDDFASHATWIAKVSKPYCYGESSPLLSGHS